MNELTKRFLWMVVGIICGLFIASNIWLHWRISHVEATTIQIVNFLNQSQKQVQPAQDIKPK